MYRIMSEVNKEVEFDVCISQDKFDITPLNIRIKEDGLIMSLSLKEAEELNDKLGFAIQDYRLQLEEGLDG